MSSKPFVLLLGGHRGEHRDLEVLLESTDLRVVVEPQPRRVMDHVNGTRPVVIVLDTGMPLPGGSALIQSLQSASDCGVIILCEKADPTACILGLEMGADDVVERDRDPREVVARVHRLITRARQLREEHDGHQEIMFSYWCLNIGRRELSNQDGTRVHLTRGEFELLSTLASRQGKVMSRDQLLDHISHREWAPSDRTVDVLINRLRHKIGENPREPRHLVTVHGVGYVFNP